MAQVAIVISSGFVFPLYIGNKIFMNRSPSELILKNSKKVILYSVKSNYQRLNLHSIDLPAS